MIKLLIGCLAILVAIKSFAATTATLQLKGSVPSILEVSVSPETVATSLPLETTQTSTKVGTVTERSNSKTGYKVTVSSTNQGKLVLDATNFVPYTLTYNGNAVNLAGQTFSYVFTSSAPVQRDVMISYTGNEELATGDYVDTVTFTIAVN
jgi:hypothetical protein